MKNVILWVMFLVSFVVCASASATDKHTAGELVIEHAQIRGTPPGAPVSAGYLVVRNTGPEADRLIGVQSDFSGKAEIHEMKMDAGVMKMRPLADGIKIPAGGEVVLKPGGLHLMFMKLSQTLEIGGRHEVTLRFEKAGEVVIGMTVIDPADLVHK